MLVIDHGAVCVTVNISTSRTAALSKNAAGDSLLADLYKVDLSCVSGGERRAVLPDSSHCRFKARRYWPAARKTRRRRGSLSRRAMHARLDQMRASINRNSTRSDPAESRGNRRYRLAAGQRLASPPRWSRAELIATNVRNSGIGLSISCERRRLTPRYPDTETIGRSRSQFKPGRKSLRKSRM